MSICALFALLSRDRNLCIKKESKLICALVLLHMCSYITDHTCNSNGRYENEYIISLGNILEDRDEDWYITAKGILGKRVVRLDVDRVSS
jgi:hypothetical protein